MFSRYSFHLRRLIVAGTFLLGAASMGAQAQTEPVVRLPVTQLSAGIHTIQAEIANSEETRRTGLMFRESMKATEGMLFVFEAPDQQCFWMKNTLIPLSVAFISDDGVIGNIADMAPQTLNPHCSKGAVRYVLEMNQGWFQERGITPGMRINGLP